MAVYLGTNMLQSVTVQLFCRLDWIASSHTIYLPLKPNIFLSKRVFPRIVFTSLYFSETNRVYSSKQIKIQSYTKSYETTSCLSPWVLHVQLVTSVNLHYVVQRRKTTGSLNVGIRGNLINNTTPTLYLQCYN